MTKVHSYFAIFEFHELMQLGLLNFRIGLGAVSSKYFMAQLLELEMPNKDNAL